MDAHIDAFALNMAYADPTNEPALAMAFPVAEALGFRLFFSFDYAGGGPWDMQDVISLIRQYSSSSSYWYYNGQPFVSTFEGPGNSKDWVTIKKDTNCFFIPDWSSLGAKAALELKAADGLFNWAAWPWGNENMNTYVDASYFQYLEAAGDLPYMMPVSPWFYTNLPGYDKNWMWRGDDLWHDRWVEVWYTQPEFVEIISWNDYGESHYIGPLRPDAMAAFDIGKAPFNYAANMPHDAWRLFLPYYIDTYKNNISEIQQEGLVSWYRLEPAAACPSGGTSGNTASQLQLEFEPKDIAQDMIFYSALLTSPAEVTVTIDGQTQSGTWEWAPNSQIGGVGVYHGSVPFNGLLGEVTITLSRGGETIMSIEGPAITDTCPHGIANWNAWVGGDTGPVVSAKPSLKLNEQECIAGTGAYNFEGLCSFACEYGYCPIGACTCQQQGAPKKKPTATSVTGYPLAGEDASYSGLCSFDCTYGYCPDTACGTTSAPLSIPTVSDFLPPTCVGGTGSGEFEGLCSFSCHYGYCPIDLCTCTEQGALILAPSSTSYYGVAMATSTTPPSLAFQGLCSFACGHGYCPKGACYEAVIDIETDDNVSLAGFNCKNPVENVTSNQILEQYVEWGTAYIDEWFQKSKLCQL
ncbi:carbohydrate-binding module family 24 protein [Penicillium lagena]|uniref:carbohydrate-binding module family 24 protein n=1 Tax=Penicillium lagena TaxID=94218 RepID=UPI002541B970|nr:carbohydrate-binding module family 24 protein [Penicillium lagena]KAJ5605270.1 carbohydrate-binding module family 24 protein [Penicillium lagena]